MIRALLTLAIASALPFSAHAEPGCRGDGPQANPATLIVRTDNDVYGRANQDQGYTAGAAITWVSPNLHGSTDDTCLPAALRWADRGFGWLQPDDVEQRNMVLTYTHALYTPTDGTRADLIVDDRPYAGVLMLGMGWNGRRGDRLSSTHLRLGMTGPSARRTRPSPRRNLKEFEPYSSNDGRQGQRPEEPRFSNGGRLNSTSY